MPATVYYDNDADLAAFCEGKTVASYRLWQPGPCPRAECMKESGVNVIVGLRPGQIVECGRERRAYRPARSGSFAKQADIIMILVNDEYQAKLYKEAIEPNLALRATRLRSDMGSISTSGRSYRPTT